MNLLYSNINNKLPQSTAILIPTTLNIRNFYLIVFLCLLSFPTIMCVKREEFKRCDQSSFCTRQKAFADLVKLNSTPSSYALLVETLSFNKINGRISADILNRQENVLFSFQFYAYKNGAARIQIKEKTPLKPRWNGLEDLCLTGTTLPDADLNYHQHPDHSLEFSFGNNIAFSIIPDPFKFEVTSHGIPIITFNERNYFYFEHTRNKPTNPTSSMSNESVMNESKDNEEVPPLQKELSETEKEIERLKSEIVKDQWEEFWIGKQDTKPNGPQSIGFDISFPGSTHVYGLPEHAASFSLKTTKGGEGAYSDPYRLHNMDVFEYELNNPMALYGSVPIMISHKKKNSAGVFWLNSAEMWVDIEKSQGSGNQEQSSLPFTLSSTSPTTHTHWMAETGIVDLFVLTGPNLEKVFEQYASLTGAAAMPQYFATAYHQCRWNYRDEADVRNVNAGFDQFDIPYDVLWLDIEHTDGKRYFTWDKDKFPDPIAMQKNLSSEGRKMVTIIDPHIKKDDDYKISKQAEELDLYVKNKDGQNFIGQCWPGESRWLDYLNPAARFFWASKFSFSEYLGSTETLFTWNDMNEPSVFDGPEVTMYKDCLHYGNVEHREAHNAYGMLLHRSTFEGHLQRMTPSHRPFVLSRAFFVGTQKYGAIWTGDNSGTWEHLASSTPMLLSVGFGGIAFCGADVGGFFNNPTPDLLLRWYQVGAFQPFFRAHSQIDTKRREPWLFGEPYTSLIRKAIRTRYRLLPYLYTLFFESHRKGSPIMRPLVYEFPDDETIFDVDDQFMLGSALLVHPVVTQDATTTGVYLPSMDVWYDYETHSLSNSGHIEVSTPLEKIPVFLRAGTIIPRRDRVRRASSLMSHDPYTLIIALNNKGEASGSIYVDDGETYDYQQGKYIYKRFEFRSQQLTSQDIRISEFDTGSTMLSNGILAEFNNRIERIILLGPKLYNNGFKKAVVKGMDGITIKECEIWEESATGPNGWKLIIKNPAVDIADSNWTIHFS